MLQKRKSGPFITCLCGDCKTCKERPYYKARYERDKKRIMDTRRLRMLANPELLKRRRNAQAVSREELVAAKKKYVFEYKSHFGCQICGLKDPECLDFHHISDNKKTDVASITNTAANLGALLLEICKCVVICANCHRRLHKQQRLQC